MTNNLRGNIVANKRFRYNQDLVDLAVIYFMERYYYQYSSKHKIAKGTRYSYETDHGKPRQPYIWVPYLGWAKDENELIRVINLTKIYEFPEEHENLSALVIVESEGNVTISNRKKMQDLEEIYNVTKSLCKLLRQRLQNRDINYLFNDEKGLYLPKDIKKRIKEAESK